MPLDVFAMERMQSTWENVVERDMSESGIRAVTMRELIDLGLDLDALLDTPLGYSQSNGTLALRERLAALYPGATPDHIEVTNGTSEANYVLALSQLGPGTRFALEVPNYLQLWGVPRGLGAAVDTFHLRPDATGAWRLDEEELERAIVPGTKLVYVTNPNNPTGAVLTAREMERIVARCEAVGAYLIADEVYQGSEINGARTPSFWGMSDRVIVTSGLSKAYGIPGVRIGWIVGPTDVVARCWAHHDYLTIGPSRLSDAVACVAVAPAVRERLYRRTRTILRENLPVFGAWVSGLHGLLEWSPPAATATAFVRCAGPLAGVPSHTIATHLIDALSVLIVPGSHFGLEGYLRIWTGGAPDVLADGLARIARGLDDLARAPRAVAAAGRHDMPSAEFVP
ncbi:MAG: aminotransferase class I/II-fold pyridoxal phosphate-dependent enzyme [Gemmatimonadaceae bacterium]|nr:aminotransferase class I/II-fold pyridoxal phosphate-dependent enzyme [Gemmatimonadaceae bacterium]